MVEKKEMGHVISGDVFSEMFERIYLRTKKEDLAEVFAEVYKINEEMEDIAEDVSFLYMLHKFIQEGKVYSSFDFFEAYREVVERIKHNN